MAGGPAVLEQTTRKTVCLSQPEPDLVIHDGDSRFPEELSKLYKTHESKVLEGLVELKTSLKHVADSEFWSYLSERLAELLGAQMSFVSKRMLVDEQDCAVEMPPIGEPGACLMASALYYNDGQGSTDTLKAFKYHAYGCPCGYMRHDKVFIIPEKLNSFILDNPNALPFSAESYIGVPLFADGKCFAHFGVIWSDEGAKNRTLSWANVELLLHSLEDLILEKLLQGSNFRDSDQTKRDRSRIIPHAAVTAAQSLKPYARSLSHELRTPMQGVVGMLDVMYATVLEASESQINPEVRKVFDILKENIEVVQDSSRRAVEAADNVVHAYDMDMHVPEASHHMVTGETFAPSTSDPPVHDRPGILVAGSNLPIQRPNKRRRGDDGRHNASPSKIPATIAEWTKRSEPSDDLVRGVHEAKDIDVIARETNGVHSYDVDRAPSPPKASERSVAPGLRHTQLRNVLQYVVNEGLKVGGRPEYANAHETDLGECIEVRTSKGAGEMRTKHVEWSVDPSVPTTMFVDEKDLGKLISCVVLNSIKFTNEGRIDVTARMSSRSRHVVIVVSDSGPGIPKAFLPKLFKPFSQEDPSLTRQSEGLGLGLLVAKGLARKLGGDLLCIRTETEGPKHGTDFEIRIPVSPADHISRPPSPLESPSYRSGRFGSMSEEAPLVHPRAETSNPFPTPTDEPPEVKTSSDTNSHAQPSFASLIRKPSLPQTPRLEKIDKLGFQLPAAPPSPSLRNSKPTGPQQRPPMLPRKSSATISDVDRDLANKYPLTFLVAEDNKINRKLLVSMLTKFGYKTIHEAYDGAEAVRQMEKHSHVDVVLMDLWMPFMDGYEATQKILDMKYGDEYGKGNPPTVLAVTADVTDGALEKAAKVGMKGFMTKPFKLLDLQRLILEYCTLRAEDSGVET
ncbi:Hybrid signal transduction histidine kinase J [Sphaceloma murrayae]|uniref:histidine kinase n=1 Tax=Sphaceloma murrayae TaxID=2082308 RepID=A0A2K1QVR9_9PEZI|nr:Hybrid signal transduction histidine kinase J [Sphaceloma murrayae]